MKKYLIAFISLSVLIFTGCSKNDFGDDGPSIHDSTEIDLDGDGIADYEINYSGVDIDPLTLSGGVYGISGRLRPYGKNEILRHREEGYLFLRNIEDLEENVEEPLKWRNSFSGTIVSIATTNAEGKWPNKWEIESSSNHSTYFLGLKVVNDFGIKLGWVEIDINRNNGSVSIVNKGIL